MRAERRKITQERELLLALENKPSGCFWSQGTAAFEGMVNMDQREKKWFKEETIRRGHLTK